MPSPSPLVQQLRKEEGRIGAKILVLQAGISGRHGITESFYVSGFRPLEEAYGWFAPLTAELTLSHAQLAMKLASKITRHGELLIAMTPFALGDQVGLSEEEVCGCLYDLEAAGLLQVRLMPGAEIPHLGVDPYWKPSLENLYRGADARRWRRLLNPGFNPNSYYEEPYEDNLLYEDNGPIREPELPLRLVSSEE